MVEIVQNNNIKEKINLENANFDLYYDILNDDNKIGFAAISFDSNNMLYIFINEKNRGYGFGKEAFDKLIGEFLKYNISKINIMINSNNIQMKKIVYHKNIKLNFKNSNIELYELKI